MGGAILDERTLRRIIALLVALAGLAERAAARAFPVRFVVLCLLRRAEAVAIAYAADETWLDLSGFDVDTQAGFGALDAAILALRLRTLAALLSAVLRGTEAPEGQATASTAKLRGGEPVAHPVIVLLVPSQALYDTS